MTTRFVTCIGDATNPATWSGITYHLIQAGRRVGFLSDGWRLFPERVRGHRAAWNLLELLRTGEHGGYQYTVDFARRMLAQVPADQRHGEVISTFPVFPPAAALAAPVNFYIDATFTQLFDEYGKAALVSSRVQREALARERDQYAAAEYICCMSSWAASSLIEDYGVPAGRVHVVGGGANIEATGLSASAEPAVCEHRPLRLGFVGKDWRRKGLPFLLEVAEALERRGTPVEVRAAGFEPAGAPQHRLLVSEGFIDKRRDAYRFRSFLAACDFGCLFSAAEAYGLSNVEFLRLGVPVITWDLGGMADTVPHGCGYVFEKGSGADDIADWLAAVVAEPEQYRHLLKIAKSCSDQFTWEAVVQRMQAVWDGSGEYSCARMRDG